MPCLDRLVSSLSKSSLIRLAPQEEGTAAGTAETACGWSGFTCSRTCARQTVSAARGAVSFQPAMPESCGCGAAARISERGDHFLPSSCFHGHDSCGGGRTAFYLPSPSALLVYSHLLFHSLPSSISPIRSHTPATTDTQAARGPPPSSATSRSRTSTPCGTFSSVSAMSWPRSARNAADSVLPRRTAVSS